MKNVGWIVVIAVAALIYFNLGTESSNPEYNTVELAFEGEHGRQLGVTLVEKLPPGASCSEDLMTKIANNLRDSCGRECRIAHQKCGLNLTPTLHKAFENQILDTPYFSYEKGGLLPQQDFRLLFHGLDRAEAEGACVRLREMLKSDALMFIGGATECVRRSITR